MVKINGEMVEAEGKSISEYIQEAGYKKERIVVELNLEIIPRDKYDTVIFKKDDSVEILNFVGGG